MLNLGGLQKDLPRFSDYLKQKFGWWGKLSIVMQERAIA